MASEDNLAKPHTGWIEASESGGGTGGGPIDHADMKDGNYAVTARQMLLLSCPPMPPATPGPNIITILAAGTGVDGRVEVRGSQGVRVTAGPPMLPPTTADDTQGVEIVVGETQNVTIQRGLLPVDQKIEMTPSGITIDAGTGTITLKSLMQISLEVAGGLSTVTLGPEGVTIQGLITKIN